MAVYRLLLIDDDLPVRHSIAAFLEDSGFEVIGADDGQAGMALFSECLPHLVITDLRMPLMDGLTLLSEIQAARLGTPVIVISGAGGMNDVVEALRLGASDYLIKPIVDMQVLIHAINKSLERYDLQQQNQQYRHRLEQANKDLKEHLRELEHDQLAGRQVQQRMLPVSPLEKQGYQFSHQLIPSLYLSGDFVDYAYLGDRYWAFYLADVSGHGASSAFVTIWLKHLVSRMVREEGLFSDASTFSRGCAEVMTRLNNELHDTRLNHHMTLFVGVIDTHTHQLNYSVAGHLPMPLLVTESGGEFLSGQGKPIGLFKEASWDVYQLTLPNAFSLTCFSDGILEVLPEQKLSEREENLRQRLSKGYGTLDTIRRELQLNVISDAPDDIAMLHIAKGELFQ